MKIQVLTLFLASVLMLQAKCKKDSDDPASQLPEASQIGKNTFGALVNGQLFLPETPFLVSSNYLTAYYAANLGGKAYTLAIEATNSKNNNGTGLGFQFHADSIVLKTGDQFQLMPTGSKTGITARYMGSTADPAATDYTVAAPLTGTIRFTKVDTDNKILSAVFSFDAVNNKGEKVQVTNGRFDLRYR